MYAGFQLATWSYFLAFFSIEKILCFEFYVSFQPLLYRNQKQQKRKESAYIKDAEPFPSAFLYQ